ncbi:hypothetical protein BKA56DRAFT_492184 [Ilyonectria sp. MPI-CAGE-AT-0026]|nr:hypothetical protein BKA56DRAFT_492184 [Ilyonectria sp. MPI-CAGE-AT-0026]
MQGPKFFVVARVVGRDGGMPLWKERLVHLCDVSATELYGDSYYWGEDLDGEPDTLWGLEGYTHPIGFFIDHVSSNVFKREMALVDKDELLRHQQGLGSPDYDLHHYDQESGWLKREDDPDRHSESGYVCANSTTSLPTTCLTGFEPEYTFNLTALCRTKTDQDYQSFRQRSLASLLEEVQPLCSKTEVHFSKSFGGHLDLKAGTQ